MVCKPPFLIGFIVSFVIGLLIGFRVDLLVLIVLFCLCFKAFFRSLSGVVFCFLFFVLGVCISWFLPALDIKNDQVYFVEKVTKKTSDKIQFIGVGKSKVWFQFKGQWLDVKEGDLIKYGGRIQKIKRPTSFENSGFSDYLIQNDIKGVVFDFNPPQTLKSRNNVIEDFRNFWIRKIKEVNDADENGKSLIVSLLLGDRSFLSKTTMNGFREAGVVHVLAISGLHVGILFFTLKILFELVLSLRGKTLFVLICFGLICYSFIAGLSTSVIRATIMFVLIQLGQSFKLQYSSINIVLITGVLMLTWEPTWLFEIGFQLSFSAVLGILILNNKFHKWVNTGKRWIKYIKGLVLVNSAAFLFTGPILIHHFGVINLTSWWASFVLVPIIGVLMYGMFLLFLTGWSTTIFETLIFWISKILNAVVQIVSFTGEKLNLQFQVSFGIYEVIFLLAFLIFLFTGDKKGVVVSSLLGVMILFVPIKKEVKFLNGGDRIHILMNGVEEKLKENDHLKLGSMDYLVKKNNAAKKNDACWLLLSSGKVSNVLVLGELAVWSFLDSILVENYTKMDFDFSVKVP